MTASTDTSAVPTTKVIQVTNIAPQATKDQMQTLFGCIGKVEDIRLYPQIRDVSVPVQSRICYVKYFDSLCVAVAQHLTNTVFIDRALIVTPYQSSVGDIPDEYRALDIANQANIVPGLYPSDPKLPAHVINQIEGIPPNQVIATNDPVLASNGLPPYPQLPITYDSRRIEEIRRTLVAINVDENVTDDELISFFQKAGDVKYIRWCSRENDITRYALIEYSDQASVISGLKLNGVPLGSRAVQVTHATQAIAKPMAKSNEAAQREIEEAMTRVKEAQSLISAAIDPVIGILSKDKKHSHSHRRSRSRSHGRSRRRSSSRSRRGHSRSRRRRSRSRSRRRSRSRKRYRSRDRRSRDRKRSRSKKKSRSRDRKRKASRDKRRSRSKSRRRSRSRSHKKDKKYSSKRKEEKSDKRKEKDKKKDNTPPVIPEVEKKNKSATPEKEKSRSATPPRSNSRSPRSSSKSPRRSSSSGRGKTSEPIKSRSSSHIRRTLSPKRSRTRTPAHKRVSRSPRRSRTPKKRSRKSNSSQRRTRKRSASRHKSRTPTEKRHRRTRSPVRRSPSPRSPPARRVTRTPPSRSPQSPARSVSRSPVRSKRSASDSRKRSVSASRKRSLSVDRSRRSMSIDHKSRSESKSRSHTPGSARSRSPESASPPAARRSTSYTP